MVVLNVEAKDRARYIRVLNARVCVWCGNSCRIWVLRIYAYIIYTSAEQRFYQLNVDVPNVAELMKSKWLDLILHSAPRPRAPCASETIAVYVYKNER